MRTAMVCVLNLALAGHVLAATEAGEAAPSVFAGTIAQSIAAMIVFLLLLAILWKAAWGPILKGLQDRENKIKADLEHAEAAARDATATLEQYKTQLAEAQAEVRKIIDQGRAAADRLAAKLKDQAQADITQIHQRAQRDIKTAKEQAISEVYAQTAMLATQVAGKILQRQINAEDQQRFVQESLDELARSN
ncbi:MAG: F0F1 ATP synthase subunit B [Phycisphaeraceae bacterium]